MITAQDRQAFSDVGIIIQMMSKAMRNQINPNFIEFIEENKDNNYISYINKTIPLREQKLTKNTKILLSLIYRDYLCSPSARRDLLLKEQEETERMENKN